MSTLTFPRQREPALVRSFVLAFLVHVVLALVMVLGVSWQNRPAEVITVELWDPPPPRPAPKVEEAKPPPPPPAPKPEPEAKPAIKKPDIVEKAAPKPKPKPKPEPKKAAPKPKPEAKPKPIPDFDKRLREEMALEQKRLDAERQERELKALLERQQAQARAAAATARARALALWTGMIRAKIRSNIVLPRDLAGNPEAIFDVALLPTGEVLTVRKRKSSGHPGYDEAVERAILKSSPLPKPDDPSLFERRLELSFRPQD